jgi:predicted ATPase
MAYPDATIYLIEDGVLRSVGWEGLEHVRVTRDFLNNPTTYLRYLSSE